ncbi:hypothetical protein, partial [Agrococcus sp. HG114]|uniref:hypothetical protein n=1 Tax=Agrococcus sp. HG114 TaxID=2969757 RepID=UPI00215A64C0
MYPISEMNVNLQISEDGANYKDADHVVQRAFINVIFAERVHQIAYNKCRIDSEYYTAEQNARHILTELDNTSM